MFARITLRPGYTRLKDDDKYWIQYKTKSGSVYKEYECSFTDLFPFVIPEDQCITYFKIELDNKDVFLVVISKIIYINKCPLITKGCLIF